MSTAVDTHAPAIVMSDSCRTTTGWREPSLFCTNEGSAPRASASNRAAVNFRVCRPSIASATGTAPVATPAVSSPRASIDGRNTIANRRPRTCPPGEGGARCVPTCWVIAASRRSADLRRRSLHRQL